MSTDERIIQLLERLNDRSMRLAHIILDEVQGRKSNILTSGWWFNHPTTTAIIVAAITSIATSILLLKLLQ